MSSSPQYIAKGFYTYSQIDQFISVKNYFFVQNDDQKYLLLRFSNASDFIANTMDFTVIQLNSSGTILEKTPVHYTGLMFTPGSTHTPETGIPVHPFCTDFKVEFSQVTSKNYIYEVRDGQVTVLFTPTSASANPIPERKSTVSTFSVHPIKSGKQGLAVLCGICALLLLISIATFRMYGKYRDATKDDHPDSSTQYFITDTNFSL